MTNEPTHQNPEGGAVRLDIVAVLGRDVAEVLQVSEAVLFRDFHKRFQPHKALHEVGPRQT